MDAQDPARSRHQIDADLDQQAALLSALLAHSPEGMALIDTDFVFRAANESYSRQVGIPLDDIVGRTTEALSPGWKAQVAHLYHQVRETGEPFQSHAYPFSIPDHPEQGTSYWDVTISPVLGRGGECIGFLLLHTDVTQQVLAEQRSQESYRPLFESVSEGFTLYDVVDDENGNPWGFRYLDLNPAGERMIGLARDQVVGRTLRQIFPNLEPHWLDNLAMVALSGESVRFEVYTQATSRWWDMRAFRPKPGQVATLNMDVTEHKRAEELQALLAAIVNSSEDAIIGKTLEGIITDWNPAAQDLYGYEAEEAIGKPISMLTPTDRPDELPAIPKRLRRGERIDHCETVRMRKDGSRVDVSLSMFPITDASGKIVGAATVAHDITEHKRAEERARQLEDVTEGNQQLTLASVQNQELAEEAKEHAEQMSALLASLGEGVYVADPSGGILVWNAAAVEITGMSVERAQEIVAGLRGALRPDGSLLPPEEWPISRALRGEEFTGEEVVIPREESKRQHLVFNSGVIRNGDGHVRMVILVFRDVTELRRLEQYRQEYVSIISHDLRNPLTPLIGHAQWLQRLLAQKGMEKEARSAEAIFTNAKRMNSMIADLLETTRLESGEMELHRESTDLGSLLADLLRRIGTDEDRPRLRLEIPEWVPPVSVDPNRIERVVSNLITNALKYSEPGTPVRGLLERRDGSAVLSVIDQGPGIPPEDLAHLFERFYRAKGGQKKEGLGLGLYISRLIVEAHGGRLWAESEPGKGSVFYVSLPIRVTATPLPTSPHPPATPPSETAGPGPPFPWRRLEDPHPPGSDPRLE